MTNEEILKDFIVSAGERIKSAFIDGLRNNTSDYYVGANGVTDVYEAMDNTFCWESTDGIDFDGWSVINDDWLEICEENNLSGEVDMGIVISLLELKYIPKLGEVVQILHEGLTDWLTIKVLSGVETTNDNESRIRVRYINKPSWFDGSCEEDGYYYQYNVETIKFRSVPITSEQILVMFLKKHRKYSAFKRNSILDNCTLDIRNAIDSPFSWIDTPEGYAKWSYINNKWLTMCREFNLTGTIDINKVIGN